MDLTAQREIFCARMRSPALAAECGLELTIFHKRRDWAGFLDRHPFFQRSIAGIAAALRDIG